MLPTDGCLEFANLPPGDYRLQFRRETGDSIIADVHPPLKVHIAQVFYKSKWAIALYIIMALSSIGWLIYRYYRREIRKEQQQREDLLRQREIEAHNEKMAIFSSVADKLRSPLALIRNPLKNILRNHEEGGELIDDLLVISNGADQLSDILQHFSDTPDDSTCQQGQEPGKEASKEDSPTQKYLVLPASSDIRQISDTDAEFIRQFDSIVMENISDSEFGNEQLAAKLCMSKSTLIRRTKSILDTTPNDYILTKRLTLATKMLESSGCRINEVCYSVGFNTPSYFTKCFKRAYGMLPSEYRDRHIGRHDNTSEPPQL